MRFSSAIRSHAAPRNGARPERGPHLPPSDTAVPVAPVPSQSVAAEPPPDDLDQRVRMVGEWQLGEA